MSKLSALIVDDDQSRAVKIADTLVEGGFERNGIAFSLSISAAVKLMLNQRIDLLVVDIAIPQLDQDAPLIDGGQSLLRQLEELSPQIVSPRWTIAITALDQALQLSAIYFNQRMVSVLNATPGSSGWDVQLRKFCERAIESSIADHSHQVDVCIITALRSPELESLSILPITWGLRTISPFLANQHSGELRLGKETRTVEAFTYDKMGLVPMAYLAAAVVEAYRPRIMVLTGICGGVPDSVQLGDVVVAESSWNWQSGKLKEHGSLRYDGDSIQASPTLTAVARHVGASMETRMALMMYGQYIQSQKDRLPLVHVGPMASGSVVVADEKVKETVLEQNRKVVALDMEAYAFYAASRYAAIGSTQLICVKSVCDKADSKKADDIQVMCAQRSAHLANSIISSHFLGLA